MKGKDTGPRVQVGKECGIDQKNPSLLERKT